MQQHRSSLARWLVLGIVSLQAAEAFLLQPSPMLPGLRNNNRAACCSRPRPPQLRNVGRPLPHTVMGNLRMDVEEEFGFPDYETFDRTSLKRVPDLPSRYPMRRSSCARAAAEQEAGTDAQSVVAAGAHRGDRGRARRSGGAAQVPAHGQPHRRAGQLGRRRRSPRPGASSLLFLFPLLSRACAMLVLSAGGGCEEEERVEREGGALWGWEGRMGGARGGGERGA
eukprot:833417-Rhodomonas_salina.3